MDSKSEYGFNTTAEEIANGHDLTGKNVIVTGGYTGIGRETSRVLAEHGANVFVVGRDMNKANKVVEELQAETGKHHITAMEMDLASLASIRSFAEKFNALKLPLHLLINNAGVMACPHATTKDGFEMQFGTNFIGHFLLTNLLLSRLIEAAPSRVVNVSSSGHLFSGIHWNDMNFEKCYSDWTAYGQSKTANILFSVELTRRYKSQGVTSSSLHPGYIKTDLQRHTRVGLLLPSLFALPNLIKAAKRYSSKEKTVEQGAATTMFAALSPEAAEGGKFYDDCKEAKAAKYAVDPEDAARLWDIAAKMVQL